MRRLTPPTRRRRFRLATRAPGAPRPASAATGPGAPQPGKPVRAATGPGAPQPGNAATGRRRPTRPTRHPTARSAATGECGDWTRSAATREPVSAATGPGAPQPGNAATEPELSKSQRKRQRRKAARDTAISWRGV